MLHWPKESLVFLPATGLHRRRLSDAFMVCSPRRGSGRGDLSLVDVAAWFTVDGRWTKDYDETATNMRLFKL